MKLRKVFLSAILATLVITAAYCEKKPKDEKQKSHHPPSQSKKKQPDGSESNGKPHPDKINKIKPPVPPRPPGNPKSPALSRPPEDPKSPVLPKSPILPRDPKSPILQRDPKSPDNPKPPPPPPRKFRKIKTWIRKDDFDAVMNWAERNNVNFNTMTTAFDKFRYFHSEYCSSSSRSSSSRCGQKYNDLSPEDVGFEDPQRGIYFDHDLAPIDYPSHRNAGSSSTSAFYLFTISFILTTFLTRMPIF